MSEAEPKTLYDVFAIIRQEMGQTWPIGTFMSEAQIKKLKRTPLTPATGKTSRPKPLKGTING